MAAQELEPHLRVATAAVLQEAATHWLMAALEVRAQPRQEMALAVMSMYKVTSAQFMRKAGAVAAALQQPPPSPGG